jgi:hypothetical protein
MGRMGITTGVALLAVLGACSGIARHDSGQPVRDRFAAYAGPPIDQFTWLGRFDSWQSLGRSELVVFTTPWDAYLLKIWLPCDTRFANTISLTSTGGAVHAHLDAVRVAGQRCPIDEIRRIDYRRLQADLTRDVPPKTEVTK